MMLASMKILFLLVSCFDVGWLTYAVSRPGCVILPSVRFRMTYGVGMIQARESRQLLLFCLLYLDLGFATGETLSSISKHPPGWIILSWRYQREAGAATERALSYHEQLDRWEARLKRCTKRLRNVTCPKCGHVFDATRRRGSRRT